MNSLLSRRSFAAGLGALGVGWGVLLPRLGWGQQPLTPPPHNPEQVLFSLRSLMEVCCREAIEVYRDRLPLTFTGHVRKAWQDWIREDKTSANSPFLRFEVFDAFSRYVAQLLWEESLHHFMQKAHVLTPHDLKLMLVSVGTGHVIGTPWATTLLERKAHDHWFSRMLVLVIEIELHWLVTQTERYRHNPPARFGQIDTPEYEVAMRVTRALLYTLVDGVSARERHWRQLPTPDNPPLALRPILAEIAKFYREPSPDAPGAPPPGEPVGKSAVAR